MKSIILFLGILGLQSSIYAKTKYCANYMKKPSKEFIAVKANITREIKKLSNYKSITLKADAILAKLIQAKSPIITRWMSKRNLDPAIKQTEILAQWREYYFTNFILNNYPNNSQEINLLIEKFFNEVNSMAFNEKTKKKYNNLFNEAVLLAISRIKTSKLSDQVKERIIDRFQNIKLYWFNMFKNSKFKKMPL